MISRHMYKLCITGDLGFEFWQDIPGFERVYQASTYGRIRSKERFRKGKSNSIVYVPMKILNTQIKNNGYVHCCLSLGKHGEYKTYSVHQIVAKTFLPKWRNEYNQINHKDENKTNNRVENLEWCDCKYNNNYGMRIEKMKSSYSKSLIQGKIKLNNKPVLQYSLNNIFIAKFSSATEVQKKLGYHSTDICSCCKGKNKTAYGYIWRYANC